jgi:hypothetical protein
VGDVSGVEEEEAAAAALQRRRRHKVFDAHLRRFLSSASVDDDDDEDDDVDDDSENAVSDDVDVADTENWKCMVFIVSEFFASFGSFGLVLYEATKEWEDGRDDEPEERGLGVGNPKMVGARRRRRL